MVSAELISKLSHAQRTILLEHIDKPLPISRAPADQPRRITTVSLIRYGLLHTLPLNVAHPRQTSLSEAGRGVVARLLSEYAETLIRAGCLEVDENTAEELRPMRMLQRLKKLRQTGKIAPKEEEEPAVIEGDRLLSALHKNVKAG